MVEMNRIWHSNELPITNLNNTDVVLAESEAKKLVRKPQFIEDNISGF